MSAPRICSLLPSATEMVAALGLLDQVVAVSEECDFPAEVRGKPVVTASRVDTARLGSLEIDSAVRSAVAEGRQLYAIDEEALRRLAPDVILTQDLCEVCSIDLRTVQRIAAEITPVPRIVNLNPNSLLSVLDDLLQVG